MKKTEQRKNIKKFLLAQRLRKQRSLLRKKSREQTSKSFQKLINGFAILGVTTEEAIAAVEKLSKAIYCGAEVRNMQQNDN